MLMQDNKSAILLDKYCSFSIGKESKYINMHYFFIVDKIQNKDIKIVYCLIAEIVTDYSSKSI